MGVCEIVVWKLFWYWIWESSDLGLVFEVIGFGIFKFRGVFLVSLVVCIVKYKGVR